MRLVLSVTLNLLMTLVATETKPDVSLSKLSNVVTVVGQKFEYVIGDDKFHQDYEIYRVVERGSKTLPGWLSFDKNSSQLAGVPSGKDVGTYNIRMRACMIEKTNTDCENKISRSFQIDVVEPMRTEAERGSHLVPGHDGMGNGAEHYGKPATPDRPPRLQNPINQIEVHIGKYYEYRIPYNTFNDSEDGSTRNLSLSVNLIYGKPLPTGAWLMFNETSQTLYGIPMWQDIVDDNKDRIMTIILTAKDSVGQIKKDAIQVVYNKSHYMGHSYKIHLGFKGEYKEFMQSRNNLISVGHDIAEFFGDSTLDFLTFLEVSSGSLDIVLSNSSLSGEKCHRNEIQEVFDRIADSNGSVLQDFSNVFSNNSLNLTSAKLEFVGVCLLPLTTREPTLNVTNSPASSSDNSDNNKFWIEVVIPALAAILLLVIVALILLICCRHRHSRKKLSKTEKPMFLEDRRPIIFPEELEMTDSNLKPKTPLVLPSDLASDRPPPVPPHRGRSSPQPWGQAPEQESFLTDSRPPPPQFDQSQASEPPAYRLPPPYFNPHRTQR